MKLSELAKVLDAHPPCTGPNEHREAAFAGLDGILMDRQATGEGGAFDIGGRNRAPSSNPIKDLYEQRVLTALQEIEAAEITGGFAIWQLYNMGYVVKTPTATIGFDVVRGLRWYDWGWDVSPTIITGLARCLDALLVSHYVDNHHTHEGCTWLHVDHYDHAIAERMLEDGKPVFIPTGHEDHLGHDPRFIYTGHQQRHELLGMRVTSYGGRHIYQDTPFATPLMLYEVVTPQGQKIFFTGDFDYTGGDTFPDKDDIDLLILHTGGVSPLYDDQNPNDLGDDDDAFFVGLQRFKSKLVVAGHLAELSHPPGGGRESYGMAFDIFRQLLPRSETKLLVLFWGESFHVEPSPKACATATERLD